MTAEPVLYTNDTAQRARKIHCAVCRVCEWQSHSKRCIYGGPYSGFDKPESKETER